MAKRKQHGGSRSTTAMSDPISPTTFLSPRITADLDNSLDAIEELLLHDANASPKTALAHTLNTTTPATTNQHSVAGRERSNSYALSNAVHMEVQENAKLPTFNLPVNRSTSSWNTPAFRGRKKLKGTSTRRRNYSIASSGNDSAAVGGGLSTSTSAAAPESPIPKLRKNNHQHEDPILDSPTTRAIDEIMRLNENDMNLTELFLDEEDRSGAARAYSYSGGMPQLQLPTVNSLEDLSDGKQKQKTKSNGVKKQGQKRPNPDSSGRILPYRRQRLGFPIPKLKPPSPPKGSAVATATVSAASVSTNAGAPCSPTQTATSLPVRRTFTTSASKPNKQQGAPPTQTEVSSQPNSPPRAGTNSNTTTTTTRLSMPLPTPQPKYPPHHNLAQAHARREQPSSFHATANAKPKSSITHATAQRSKFGFSGDHKVPSVPAPPCKYTPKLPVATAAGRNMPTTHIFPLYKPAPAIAPPRNSCILSTALPKDVGNVVAYERKKQRAKDARVKLNEAIEGLGVAIDLAGSQSKERFNYIVRTTHCINPHSSNEQSKSLATTHPLAKMMDVTIQQAASAKKWDRPSFVGLSATIIRSLNAQCEGLLRECAQLRAIAKEKVVPDINPSYANTLAQTNQVDVNGVHDGELNDGELAFSHGQSPNSQQQLKFPPTDILDTYVDDNVAAQQAEARLIQAMAINEEQRCLAIHNTVETSNLLKHIASFLDPTSLGKCLCVSKRWRGQNIFQNPVLWINICIKRFGVSAVRKWQDQEADDGMSSKRKRKVDVNYNTNLELYRRMSEENVRPYSTFEGTQFLGGSSLDGLLSCWVTLMDRSNGETSRSVMQQMVQPNSEERRQFYGPIPVVELRVLIQNTGYSNGVIIIPDQQFSVDASTRRKGEKMLEVSGDDRFKTQALHIERSASPGEPDPQQQKSLSLEMCHLRLFESAVLAVHIHARGCSTTAKFCHKSKGIQLLVQLNGTTRPLTIPFHCMNERNLECMIGRASTAKR